MNATFCYPKPQTLFTRLSFWLRHLNCYNRVKQPSPVVLPIIYARMKRISQKVIHPVCIHLPGDDFPPKETASRLARPFNQSGDIIRSKIVIAVEWMLLDYIL